MSQKQQNEDNISNKVQSEILEQGDIFFFYRPKVRSEQVRGIEDIRRFVMVLAPEQGLGKSIYRLFVIGKKNHFLKLERVKLEALKDTGLE